MFVHVQCIEHFARNINLVNPGLIHWDTHVSLHILELKPEAQGKKENNTNIY
jgi:hypothetical protein